MNNRFHVLDEARQIRVNDRMHITFSIGVGDGASSLAESEKFARQSLDMALGRGGDQAAVKTENGFCFFGGASTGVEKKSKTKIRSIALAMQELIENSDQVFLMGHAEYDRDTLNKEYMRDLAAGVDIQLPQHYFPNDDPTKMPPVRWRSCAHLLYANWLNYCVYQTAPYDIREIQQGIRTDD